MNQTQEWQTLRITQLNTHIVVVTLNRPEVRNAINSTMMQELFAFWQSLILDPGKKRCVILTGSGDKAFCAGADLKERLNLPSIIWKQQHRHLQMAIRAMVDCPIPIISAVNGAAFGGGLELALASDFIYATDHAKFAQSEVKLGIMPGAMGTQNLPRACGLRRAKELCFTGEVFTAQQAFEWGIINKLLPAEHLMAETIKTAEQISNNAPLAIQQVKKALNMTQYLDLKTGYAYEVETYNQLIETKDRLEGIDAFNKKRPPIFEGS